MPDEKAQPPPRSVVSGWIRTVAIGNKYEIYWKTPSNVMLLIAHSLNVVDAENMRREFNQVLRKYHGIPFNGSSHVQHSTVADSQQTQDGIEGSLEAGTNEGG